MRKLSKALVIGATLAVGSVSAAQAQMPAPADLQMRVENSFIFVFKDSVDRGAVARQARGLTAQAGGQLGHVYSSTIRGFSAKMPAQAAERLAARNPNIAYYEPDRIAYVVMGPPGGGGGTQPAEEIPWGITRVNGGVDGTGLVAWVIDTGVDQDHPDLNVDTARSANLVSQGKNTKDDGNGHGTHVAGTIAAIDNDIGVVGVAAGATVVGVRVLDDRGSGTFADVIAGVDYVGANGAPGDVANMSLGGGFSQSVNDAVIAASNNGIFFALAAGNSSEDASNSSPASAEGANIWAVSATDINDDFASFSNFGNPPVDCADPGVDVYSTYKDGGYRSLSGTSMAAPHTAGVLLLTGGSPNTSGTANNDPDGNPDPICVF